MFPLSKDYKSALQMTAPCKAAPAQPGGCTGGSLKLPSKGFCLRMVLGGRCLGLHGSYTMDITLAP